MLSSLPQGQQLLRIGLRRRSERQTKHELMVCNGNSKKSLLDKLLSTMNVWNLRATFYDLKLYIKEVSCHLSAFTRVTTISDDARRLDEIAPAAGCVCGNANCAHS